MNSKSQMASKEVPIVSKSIALQVVEIVVRIVYIIF